MLYLKADGTTILQYPYTRNNLQQDNPETSFPLVPDEATYIAFGASVVEDTPPPTYDPMTANLTELAPSYSLGTWSRTWLVSPASPEEIQARLWNQDAETQTQMAALYDSEAQVLGFPDRIAASVRSGYVGPWQDQGLAFATWMDACNEAANALGRPLPEWSVVQAVLPPFPTTFSTQVLAP